MTAKLLKLFPPHRHYVEIFGGGASLLFAKEPAGGVEVYNDLDEGLVHFFRTLRDPEKFLGFFLRAVYTPNSRSEYKYCNATWNSAEDPIERAYKWYIVARMSFGGRFGQSWGFSVNSANRDMADTCSRWLSMLDMLPRIHARFMRVQIECRDWRFILKTYNAPGTLMYLDPPYIPETRKEPSVYRHEMSAKDHEELVETVLKAPQMILLSGYSHNIYERLENRGWIREDFKTVCFAAGRTRYTGIQGPGSAIKKQPRIECAWRNYDIKTGDLVIKSI